MFLGFKAGAVPLRSSAQYSESVLAENMVGCPFKLSSSSDSGGSSALLSLYPLPSTRFARCASTTTTTWAHRLDELKSSCELQMPPLDQDGDVSKHLGKLGDCLSNLPNSHHQRDAATARLDWHPLPMAGVSFNLIEVPPIWTGS